ncbi:hypothetical protein AgCh_038292 [Apium graveolens]
MAKFDLSSVDKSIKNLRESFIALHEVVQKQIISNIDIRVKLDQLHQVRYEPSALLMEGIKEAVQAIFAMVASQQADIQTLVDSHKHLQMQNSVSLRAIMGALNIPLPALIEVVRSEIPTSFIFPSNKTKRQTEARKLIISLETELKTKKNKTFEDEEMIKILGRYLRDPEAKLPKTQINKDDLDDDEQKKDDQKPFGSNSI